MKFRTLRADEINVRIQSCNCYNDNKCCAIYLLYKDARCDMNILDETVGCFNWQKKYSRDNANCIVSIYDEDKKQWIEKEDTGTESFSEAEKGLASDSFKRACFNWGIGRELYTAPLIKIWLEENDYYIKNQKPIPTLTLDVALINYDENKNIIKLILTDKNGKVRFEYDKEKERLEKTIPQKPKEKGFTKEQLENQYNEIKDELAKNGILITDEKVADWVKKNAKVNEVEVSLLSKEEIKAVNSAMIHLLQQKKVRDK